MPKSIVVEGKTTAEALEKGLKELNVSKNMVEIKTIEEGSKKSFYSILAPRIVKLELTVKEGIKNEEEKVKRVEKKKKTLENIEELKKIEKKLEAFLNNFLPKGIKYEIKIDSATIFINLDGEEINYLIGYRGETISSIQTIISSIANKDCENRVKVFVDAGNYKERRVKVLEELAEKVAKTVIRTKKPITLEPMTAYERKIIHTKLQESDKVKTFSKGEEPYRRLVITLK